MMRILEGTTAASGMARGICCLYGEKTEEDIPHYGIKKERVPAEIDRLNEAYTKARISMKDMLSMSEKMFGKAGDDIFRARNMVLEYRVRTKEEIDKIFAQDTNPGDTRDKYYVSRKYIVMSAGI